MARFCPLFSSSSGNCIYIGSGSTNILIDAGVSAKRITDALNGVNIPGKSISAIFITHEHSDHIAGLSIFAKKHGIPVFMSGGTAEAIEEMPKLADGLNINIINEETVVGGITVKRFATSHDCKGSSAYRINMQDGRSFAVCTDTGIVTDEIRSNISGCELVMIESNHDVNMLSRGTYPLPLKRRILSDHGHLSNGSCAKELPDFLRAGTTRFILGHLSKHNNLPDAARTAANTSLVSCGFTENMDYLLYVAPPQYGKMISL